MGYVYMLIYGKYLNFTFIRKTLTIRTKNPTHNSGLGSLSTEPIHLQLYVLFAYICGFDSKTGICFMLNNYGKKEEIEK